MHPMSNGKLARTFQLPPVRSDHGLGGQPGNRDRVELKIATSLTPKQFLTDLQEQVLKDVKLDGHWLMCAIVGYLPRMDLDVNAARAPFHFQSLREADAIQERLFNDIVAGCEADGMNDDDLVRLERFLEEYLPELATAIEQIVFSICDLLRQFQPPPYCLHKDLLPYLSGYSMQGDLVGFLHFDFHEHENRNPL